MNNKEKSLRWVANMIPDFEGKTEEEKMLLAIKRYCMAGADEIKAIEHRVEVAAKALEIACTVRTQFGNEVEFSADLYNAYLDTAEKELAEERK